MSEPVNEPSSSSKWKSRLPWLRWVILIAVLGGLAGGGAAWHRKQKKAKANAARKAPEARPKRPEDPEIYTPISPLTAEQELASFTVQPGFHADLVAAEPMIRNPVALAFAPDGKVWVCEMQGYMANLGGKGEDEPQGRIVVLEDTDGDGRMDKVTTFLDGLVLPRAISLVKDGVLVGEPPTLWFCRDTDGDGKCDEKIEIDPKFALANGASPEHKPNGLLWATDNTIYNVNSAVAYRLRPDGGFDRVPTAFRGQWGITQDDWGKLYYNVHITHLFSDLVPAAHYHDRNKFAPLDFGLSPILTTDERVWPIRDTPGINAGAGGLENGRLKVFTSACGPEVYRGELFPPEYRGNIFTCEPAANLIRRDLLYSERGITLAKNAEPGKEFLASTDERFRPVSLYTGPDGALWVVDMYCGIIQHKDYITPYLKKYVRQHVLETPTGMGRIWRIVPDGVKVPPLPKLPSGTTALVSQLEQPNGWRRDTAQRLLVQGRDPAAAPALAELFAATKLPQARVHALWTLHGLGQLDPALIEQALGDPEPPVRQAAVRLAEELVEKKPEFAARIIAMVQDPAADVRLQALLSLDDVPGDAAIQATIQALEMAEGSPYAQVAAWMSLGGRELEFLSAFLASPVGADQSAYHSRFIRGLMLSVLTERKSERCLRLLELTAAPRGKEAQDWLVTSLAILTENELSGIRPITLEREPAQWKELAASADPEKLNEVADFFSWPGKQSPLEPEVIPLTEEEQKRFAEGRTLYTQICATCHQPDGRGQAGLAPPLAGSEWVVDNHQRLVRIVLNGLAGPLVVAKRNYYMEMPSLATLSDDQIAAILTYIRREWEHTADAVTPAEVAEIRAAVGQRDKPWNVRQLRKFR